MPGQRRIVEARNRKFAWNVQPHFVGGRQNSHRHVIVAGEDGRWARLQTQKSLGAGVSGFVGEQPLLHQLFVMGDAMTHQRGKRQDGLADVMSVEL